MQKIIVICHLGKDAVVNTVNDKTVINFNVCHSEKRKVNGQQEDYSQWFQCGYFTDRTAIAPYLKKGTQVYVEGKIDVHTYTTSEGVGKFALKIGVSNVQLLGNGKPAEQEPTKITESKQDDFMNQPNRFEGIDDMPF